MSTINSTMKQVDIVPIVQYFMKELNVHELFQEHIPCAAQAKVEPADLLCVLITNILVAASPLCHVEKWVAKYADGLTKGIKQAKSFNDDRLGWALDKLFDAKRGAMLTRLSAKAIEVHQLETNSIHNDTTTVTLKGDYEYNEASEAINFKHGHNKDFRPDCKQIVFGLCVTDDGHVPLHYQLFDGNTSDSKTHQPVLQELRKILDKTDFIYIADSKLCSFENLETIAINGGRFISMMPKSRKEIKAFYTQLENESVEWQEGYTKPHSRKQKELIIFRTHEERSADGYRIIWVHSNTKEVDDRKKRNRTIKTIEEKLALMSNKLNKFHLKTRAEIEAAIKKIDSTHIKLFDTTLVENKIITKVKKGGGRPSKNSEYIEVETVEYSLIWKLEKERVEAIAKHDGVFPLITNTELEAKEVLRQYKHQPYLEKRHSTLKSVLNVAPVFLKNPTRIEALLFLYFIAMMILGLMERRIRLSMKENNIESIQLIASGIKTKAPTFNNMRRDFDEIYMSITTVKKEVVSVATQGISEAHAVVLKLLKVPSDLYNKLKTNWWRFDFMR